MVDSDSSASSSDEGNEDGLNYRAGGKRGFNTNIDDFLVKFGSFVEGPNVEQRFSKRRTLTKGPLIDTMHSVVDMNNYSESGGEDHYTIIKDR